MGKSSKMGEKNNLSSSFAAIPKQKTNKKKNPVLLSPCFPATDAHAKSN